MSAYENLRKSVEWAEEHETGIALSRGAGRNILDEIDNRLKAVEKVEDLLRSVPLEAGDVVHEVGYPEEVGDVRVVSSVGDEPFYKVHIRNCNRTIGYYREELVLMERPTA